MAKTIRDDRTHQRDSVVNRDESLPLYFNTFMDYFEYVRELVYVYYRSKQQRRQVVTCSVIEQQASLSTLQESQSNILPSFASHNREHGENTVRENLSIISPTLSDTTSSSSNASCSSPRR